VTVPDELVLPDDLGSMPIKLERLERESPEPAPPLAPPIMDMMDEREERESPDWRLVTLPEEVVLPEDLGIMLMRADRLDSESPEPDPLLVPPIMDMMDEREERESADWAIGAARATGRKARV